MASDGARLWNSLEIAKLLAAIATPLLLAAIGFLLEARIRDSDEQARAALRAAEIAERRRESVRAISNAMYARAARAAMLASGLRRHDAAPSEASLQEVSARKAAYDDEFVAWNTRIQSTMLGAREVLDSPSYTRMENHIEQRLVRRILVPLDKCLTRGFDLAIRGAPAAGVLERCACRPSALIGEERCGVGDLVYAARECAYEISESLYLATFAADEAPEARDAVRARLEERCPAPGPFDRDLLGETAAGR
ncbi:MAG: hypothetical protein ACE37J_05385 [Pikeienuella sp.]|uniref:hypothetical protein n=1 Tax=Pikeienuella sp. TaxID=2831957 RepID=UPI00391B949C